MEKNISKININGKICSKFEKIRRMGYSIQENPQTTEHNCNKTIKTDSKRHTMPSKGEIWFADVPFEDCSISKARPIVVVDYDGIKLKCYKCTTHDGECRREIKDTHSANLDKRTWVCTDTITIPIKNVQHYIGTLSKEDYERIIK
ncbi:MAG: type II toxin-antitoxin system PemK/MazF family toxin [archaeon]|nr:type II toxin-antitoxin system PemK/MazF family toxin [archaeon]